jgi:hypothetical protein
VFFSKHYTLPEARELLPQVRQWLDHLASGQSRVHALDEEVRALLAHGADAGGETVNELARAMSALQEVLLQFHRRQIQIKDVSRGLIDFPSLREGREVFLCWEKDEEDIEFWHDLETGYAGRERL